MRSQETPDFVAPTADGRVAAALDDAFTSRSGRPPEVVAAAPGRVNLIGEHLDYNGGRCLPIALPHTTSAAVGARRDRRLVVSSLQQPGEPVEVALDDLRPGAVSGWAAYVAGVVWAMSSELEVPGLEVVVDGRVPLGAGLSSSAALECAVALALAALLDLPDDETTRQHLARLCVRAETEMAGAPTGGMDQAIAMLATAQHALLLDFADDTHRQVVWRPEESGLALLVVDTRVAHELTDGGYAARRADCERGVRALGVSSLREARDAGLGLDPLDEQRVRRRVRHVLSEMDRVDETVARLDSGDLDGVGRLLDASHDSLRDDFEVSCPELDVVVETCRREGALGARMTGGGFGGSAIALLPADELESAARSLSTAFESHGWEHPRFLTAPASDGARVLRSR